MGKAGASAAARRGCRWRARLTCSWWCATRATEPATATSRSWRSTGERPASTFPRIYDKAASAFLPIGEMLLEDAPAQQLVPAGTGMRAALAAIDVARCDIAAIA